jgi:hypothetical protein
VRVAIAGTYAGPSWANVFHFQLTTSSSIVQSDLDAWLVLVANQFKTSFAPRQHSSISYGTGQATLYTPGGGVLQSQTTMSGAGTSGGTLVQDAATAKIISWLTTVYWRGGKPRTYLTGLSTGDIQGGTSNRLTTTEQTNLQTAGNGFRTACNAFTSGTITGTQLGFVSFSTGNTPRSPAVFFPITGAKAHLRLGTQRRRLGKWTL